MRSFHRFGIGFAVTLVSAGVWLGCGDDTTTTPTPTPVTDGGTTSDSTVATPDSGKDGSTTTADTGTVPADTGTTPADTGTAADTGAKDTGAAASDAGDAGDAAEAPVSCAVYCTDVIAACGTTAPYAQYQSMAECLIACPIIKAASANQMALSAVGTIDCREEHAINALPADAGSAAGGFGKGLPMNPHCWHAGPYGGSVCGDPCTSFCYLDTTFCSAADGLDGGPPPYTDIATCLAKCATYPEVDGVDAGGFGNDGGFNAAAGNTTGSNTLDCREYHLLNAMNPEAGASPQAQQAAHCPHTASISANGVCGDAGP